MRGPRLISRRTGKFVPTVRTPRLGPLVLTLSNRHNPYGYVFHADDRIAFQFEAMNMEQAERDVILTMTWEYISSSPGTFESVQSYWFDIGGCGSSEVPAQPDNVFSYSSPRYKAPNSGLIAYVGGHLHDGGTHLELMKQGRPYCVSTASYGDGHITKMSTCGGLQYSEGDDFSIVAHYDTSKHGPMTHPDGELEPVMGIALVYAVEDAPSGRTSKSHSRTGLGLAFISLVFLAMGFGFLWSRSHEGNIADTLRDWLGRYSSKARSVPSKDVRAQNTSTEDQESLLNDRHTDVYQD